jgi:hypothetical protein
MLALRQPHSLARVSRYASIFNRSAEHLAQQPECILDGRRANLFAGERIARDAHVRLNSRGASPAKPASLSPRALLITVRATWTGESLQ